MRVRALLSAAACAAMLAATGCFGGSGPPHAARPAPAGRSHHARHGFHALTGTYRGAVPILMYHVIGAAPHDSRYPALFTRWRLFARQMRALRDQVWRAWHGGSGLPRRPIVLSFDDGYRTQATEAARTLRRLRWPGVLNLEVDNLHLGGGLARAEVRGMMRSGWEIDAHTISHPDLTTVTPSRLRWEVSGSRVALRRAFHTVVDFFCYPYGRFDSTVEAAVRAAGFDGSTTTQPGLASRTQNPFELPRIRVDGGESPSTLLAAISAAA
jgi:peptidoglycan/xylan/chitin deacetylase (PgdA/CDA1 family)